MIQRAADRALCAGTTLACACSRLPRQIREHVRNSAAAVYLYESGDALRLVGTWRGMRARPGIDGCLLTDLSVEEAEPYIDAMREHNLDTVFLAAPTSTDRRLELVAKYSSGFVYLVSRTGVTGEQQSLSQAAHAADRADAPGHGSAAGGGLRDRNARSMSAKSAAVADGVVVGSAIVRMIEKSGEGPEFEQNLETFTRDLAAGLKRRNA